MANISNFSSNNPNPITGVFGTGKIRLIPSSTTFVVPTGITSVRVRLWGAGGNGSNNNYGGANAGGGAGFAIKTITDLVPGASISVSVGANDASRTSSFGAYVSATGGTNGSAGGYAPGGTGSNGDLNYSGGFGGDYTTNMAGGGGGSASLFGHGGDGGGLLNIMGPNSARGGAGGGGGCYSIYAANGAGSLFSSGAVATLISGQTPYPAQQTYIPPTSGNPTNSIDFYGCGGGGAGLTSNILNGSGNSGVNGGGAGGIYIANGRSTGGFPGGGGAGTKGLGGNGYVYLEY